MNSEDGWRRLLKPHRLGVKLGASLTVVVVLITTIAGYTSWRNQQRTLTHALVLSADQLSKSITSATWHAMLDDHRSAAYEIMSTIAAKQGIARIRMFNREAALMFSTDPSETNVDDPARKQYCQNCHGPAYVKKSARPEDRVLMGGSDGAKTLNMVTPIYNEPSCSQAACHAHPASIRVLGVLDLALSADPLEQETAEMKLQTAVVALIQVIVLVTLIILFTRSFVGVPIQELIEGTKAVGEMELDKPISIRHKSYELDTLVNSFNSMRDKLAGAQAEVNTFTERLEQKVAERTEQLKAAHQKLLHTDRLASLGQLAASVAHEINNPVSGVLNLSMLVQRIMKEGNVPEGREPEVKKYLSQISNETARVGRIVSDLLAFSRRSKPQRAQADLNKLITTTVSLVGHKLKLNDTEAVLDLDSSLPPVMCDASQIQQVILNLVMNAAEAIQTKGGGRVVVRTRFNTAQSMVEMTVEDNGEGIAPENLSKIFHPFFTTKPEGKGVGLGLAVMYGIVQAHEGDVDVKSAVGEGTTFTVTLPLNPDPHPVSIHSGEMTGADRTR